MQVRTRGSILRWRSSDEAPAHGQTVGTPAVSVVVTSKDRSDLLGLALRSVQRQEFTQWECIVVDDASLDDSVAVAQAFAEVDGRFRILRHQENRGLSAARNTGIDASCAELVCFLDDDDLLLRTALGGRLAAMTGQPPSVVGSYCDWIAIAPSARLEALDLSPRAASRPGIAFGDLAAGAPFISSSPLIRLDALRAIGGFDESMRRAEDAELWTRLLRVGYRFVYARTVGVGYRRSPGSLVLGNPKQQLADTLAVARRADRKQGAGDERFPHADTRPLSDVAFEQARLPQVLRYLALIAITDVDTAVAIGRREISEECRRSIDRGSQDEALVKYVSARLNLDTVGARRAGRQVGELLDRIAPHEIKPLRDMDPLPLVSGDPSNAREVGPPPIAVAPGRHDEFDGAVLLVAEAEYHVAELGPLHDELAGRGLKVRFMAAPGTTQSARFAIGGHSSTILPFAPEDVRQCAALVVLNDWGALRAVIEAADDAGVPTFAKVEGVQDFDDVDTGRVRRPYRSAAVILAQGQNDVDAMLDRTVEMVGSCRLERIWNAPACTPGDHALVNLNFTYNVQSAARSSWLRSVEAAVAALGVEALVSCHPAESTANVHLPTASKPFRYEIARAGVLVSRFSTVPFEAMARGVPFVYHNPHAERVPTFLEPVDAFPSTSSVEELVDGIRMARSWRGAYRDRAEKFFRAQVDIVAGRPSEVRAADVIMRHL